jgi:hypothetical protein
MAMWLRAILFASAVALVAPAAAAGDLKAFGAAVERAAAQYHIAWRTLQTAGREQTAIEVRLFRQVWQEIIDSYEADRPAELDGDDFYATTFTEVDTRLVAALIVIDIGSREAAREALRPIGDTLARLRQRAAPRAQ